mmetsp:Transcript_37622/g.91299  ORF Transcript_37622/g.91299 Transcript_37622/m.91299 type:complete len:297 (+) Transcript_37622:62-952(+)
MASRYCSNCNRCLTKPSYTKTQWSKGEGVSRCRSCVHGGNVNSIVDPSQTARRNNAHAASFTHHALENPFAQGSFRWVAMGTYTGGDRQGEQCVCKWFKTGGVMEAHFYDSDLAASNEAIRLISKWNGKRLVDRMVKVNLPEVWTFSPESMWAGRKVLQEPYIENYQKFNSNTGWADESIPWARVMQALSHFSFHISNGEILLCDLQGGVYNDGVVLTDPVVMSKNRSFGPTDLGSQGISSFFANHVCNEFCRSDWQRPRDQRQYYRRTAGTTMEHVPTRASRPYMTAHMGGIREY